MRFSNGEREYQFPIALEGAKSAVYRSRPYEILEVRGIALKPGAASAVMVDVPTTQSVQRAAEAQQR
jgi:hypothetical protein